MDNKQSTLREMALFAGAGGGILGGHLLGWKTVCAVEWEPYPASVLVARQNDDILPPFPIWDDVQTFDGKPWRGLVDVVSGGFPCQDISSAGKGAGIEGERSSMWKHMARIVGEVRPRLVYVENSPLLIKRGAALVISDLTALGYDCQWCIVSAADCGAPHKRDRFWLVGIDTNRKHERQKRTGAEQQQTTPASGNSSRQGASYQMGNTNDYGQATAKVGGSPAQGGDSNKTWPKQASEPTRSSEQYAQLADTASQRQQGQRQSVNSCNQAQNGEGKASDVVDVCIGREWPPEPNVGRVANGVAARVDRLKAIGNGQVPIVATTAFNILRSK